MTRAGELVVERRVSAEPEAIFRYFTNSERWMSWQGVDAQIDLQPGGVFRVNVTGDGFASGRFVEVVANRRIVFTWGWEIPGSPVPPGSSTVSIDLIPQEDGTLIRLTHAGLPPDELDVHRAGWLNYAGRLAARAEGRDPGPDPMRPG